GCSPLSALRREMLPDPPGCGKQGPVFMPLADHLGPDRQALGAGEHGQRHGRDMRGGPYSTEGRIPGGLQPYRRLACGTGGEQHVIARHDGIELRAAALQRHLGSAVCLKTAGQSLAHTPLAERWTELVLVMRVVPQ